jgi:lipoate synthase
MALTDLMRDDERLKELKDTLSRIELFMRNAEKSRRMMHLSQRKVLQKARVILKAMSEKEEKILERIKVVLFNHGETLEECLKVMNNVDETLCNVLLAIRQNEFLQAYYPAQNGQPSQMVTGRYAHVNKTSCGE